MNANGITAAPPFDAPRLKLLDGPTICNFSSNHQFIFQHPSNPKLQQILESCSKERSDRLSMKITEYTAGSTELWIDIRIDLELGDAVTEELTFLNDDPEIDLIIVPYMLMEAVRNQLLQLAPDGFANKQLRYITQKIRTGRKIYRNLPELSCRRFCTI